MEENAYIISNFTTICRLCLRNDGVMSCIFNNITDSVNSESLHERITEHLQIEVCQDDGLPINICHRCLYKTDQCTKFRQQCASNDTKIRQLILQCKGSLDTLNNLIKQEIEYSDELPDSGNIDEHSNSSVPSVEIFPIGNSMKNGAFRKNIFSKLSVNYKGYDDIDRIPGIQLTGNEEVESVVMVVDPSLDYDSSDQSEYAPSENDEPVDNSEFLAYESDLKNVFMCKYCDIAFREHEKCLAHECTEHDPNSPFSCHECSETFPERSVFILHIKAVHGNEKPFVCLECGKGFGRRSDLRKHTIVHTGVRPYSCHICLKAFSRNTNLTKHLRIHSGQKPHVCLKCPRSFISKGDLARHSLIHMDAKPFQCMKCDYTFARRDKLQRHEKTHEMDKKDSESDTGNMVISVDPYNDINDEYESQTYDDLPSVPDHIAELETDLKDMVYPALPHHITGDSFYENGDITHEPLTLERRKVKKRTLKCTLCPKTFSNADTFRSHMNIHLGIRNHVCQICNKAFVRKRELDRHSVVHTGYKPFKCSQCEKRFGRKDKLVRHERIHNEMKEFQCDECPASFNRKDGLVLHQKVHVKSS